MARFFETFIALAAVYPAAASCYLPMKHQLRYTPWKTFWICFVPLTLFCVGGSLVMHVTGLPSNALLPVLALSFLLFRITVRVDMSRLLAVYVGVCAIETFPAQVGNILNERLYPGSTPEYYSLEAACAQLLISCLMLAAAWLMRRQLVRTIDELDFPKIWYCTLPLSGVFLVFNVAAVAETPVLVQAGGPLLIVLVVCALALLVCGYVVFYQAAWLVMRRGELDRRDQLLEMQSRQYRDLWEHMQESARLRHDFRHTLRLLSGLAEKGDLDGIRGHLLEVERQQQELPAVYSGRPALDALFGYYHQLALQQGVETDWRVSLPETLRASEPDLAGLFGNLLENAIQGCATAVEGSRRFSLTAEVRGKSLYIVSTNTFDGVILDGYRSIRHPGRGMGLQSIRAVAEKYGGFARFDHSGGEFMADVVLEV